GWLCESACSAGGGPVPSFERILRALMRFHAVDGDLESFDPMARRAIDGATRDRCLPRVLVIRTRHAGGEGRLLPPGRHRIMALRALDGGVPSEQRVPR